MIIQDLLLGSISIITLPMGVLAFAGGLQSYWQNIKQGQLPLARTALGSLLMCIGGWSGLQLWFYHSSTLMQATIISQWMFLPLLFIPFSYLGMARCLPARQGPPHWGWILVSFLVPCGLLTAHFLWKSFLYVVNMPYGYVEHYHPHYFFFVVYFLAYLGVGIYWLWQAHSGKRQPQRLLIRYLALGGSYGLFAEMVSNLLIPALDALKDIEKMGPIFCISFSIFMGYALGGEWLQDKRFLLAKTLVYLVTFVICLT